MIVFETPHKSSIDKGNVILIGRGLVGLAIEKELINKGFKASTAYKSDWQDINRQTEFLKQAIDECITKKTNRIDFVWSAGKTGFSADKENTDREFKFFKILTELIVYEVVEKNNLDLKIHFMSSAGGLFEGERNINIRTKRTPKRPYGWLKYNQENFLLNLNEKVTICIYRLSSLYGYIKKGQRVGLISALILNLVRQKTTHIYGKYGTLRDYLFVGDAATFIANEIKKVESESLNVFTLVSGKPTTIFEIQKNIEKATMRRCYISFVDISNDSDITFAPSCSPKNFMATPLYTMIPRIYQAALRSTGF